MSEYCSNGEVLVGIISLIRSEQSTLQLGAGVSTSAGIPDFRSPKTGLYSNLARLNLPHPEAVFEIDFFRSNPVPFYTLAHELYPGKFRPTPTHSFVRLLYEKGLLLKCFTQNIDTLERRAGVPGDKIIEAHGSFATQRCIDCSIPYDDIWIKVHIKEKTIPYCEECQGLVKPDIVFFGESLPPEFTESIQLLQQADLLIVMGTSLTVYPFARLATLVDDKCPRVLINLEHVGDFASREDDILLLGKCDEKVRELCQELGWEKELNELWKETGGSLEVDEDIDILSGEGKTKVQNEPGTGKEEELLRGAGVRSEVDKLAEAIDHTLTFSRKEQNPIDHKNSQNDASEVETKSDPAGQLNAVDKKGIINSSM